jgi:hypothetical protein
MKTTNPAGLITGGPEFKGRALMGTKAPERPQALTLQIGETISPIVTLKTSRDNGPTVTLKTSRDNGLTVILKTLSVNGQE